MKKRANPLSKFKLVYRPGKAATKIALLAVIVLSTAALVAIHCAIGSSEDRAQALDSQRDSLVKEHSDLNRKISSLGTRESVIEIAEEELGMVDKDAVIFVPGN